MIKFGKGVVKLRVPIFIISLLLLIPAAIGMITTRVNYDILTYLPKDIETMKGQDILVNEFGTGAFSMCVLEDMENKDVVELKAKIEEVDHVKAVVWYDSIADLSLPMEFLPEDLVDKFNSEGTTLMAILFETSMSADETMDAIEEIRSLAEKGCFVSGMSAVVTDIKNLSNRETPVYVLIAVLLSSLVLALTMDSFLAPVFFLLSIGMAILYNLGSNVFLGEISYVTKALSAVLQLGVTMDYSIFLWHSYEENPYGNDAFRVLGTKAEAASFFVDLQSMSEVSYHGNGSYTIGVPQGYSRAFTGLTLSDGPYYYLAWEEKEEGGYSDIYSNNICYKGTGFDFLTADTENAVYGILSTNHNVTGEVFLLRFPKEKMQAYDQRRLPEDMPYNSVVYGGAETVAVFDVNEESSILALAACGEDMLLLARTEGGALYLELYDFEGTLIDCLY